MLVCTSFSSGLAFWAKPHHSDLPNREKKVWKMAFLPIPEWRLAIMYAHFEKGKEPHWKFWSCQKHWFVFLGRFCMWCCVPQKSFFSGGKWLSRNKNNSFHPLIWMMDRKYWPNLAVQILPLFDQQNRTLPPVSCETQESQKFDLSKPY